MAIAHFLTCIAQALANKKAADGFKYRLRLKNVALNNLDMRGVAAVGKDFRGDLRQLTTADWFAFYEDAATDVFGPFGFSVEDAKAVAGVGVGEIQTVIALHQNHQSGEDQGSHSTHPSMYSYQTPL